MVAEDTMMQTDDEPRQRELAIDPDAGFAAMSPMEFTRLREICGSQNDVAIELQTARRTMGRWERGERPVPGIAAVAITLLAADWTRRRERTEAAIRDARLADAREG